jgi:hypothetical protein
MFRGLKQKTRLLFVAFGVMGLGNKAFFFFHTYKLAKQKKGTTYKAKERSETVLVNVQGAQESIPRNSLAGRYVK